MASTKSIPVKATTRAALKHLKKGRQTYDEVISDLIEDREYASPEFRKEHFRRLRKEKGSPWEEVVRRLKL